MKNLGIAAVVFWVLFLLVHLVYGGAWVWTPKANHHRSIGTLRQENQAGTAFLVDSAHLVTAAHVVDKSNRAVWDIPHGNSVLASVIWRDTARDLALLRLDHPQPNLPTIPIAAGKPPIGATVEICGYGGPTRKLRHFYSKVRQDAGSHAVSHSTLLSGDSGGPVIYQGKAVGVVHGGEHLRAFVAEDRQAWNHVYPARWYYPTPIRSFLFGTQNGFR